MVRVTIRAQGPGRQASELVARRGAHPAARRMTIRGTASPIEVEDALRRASAEVVA